VFVDATPEQVISKITLYGLDAVQLHGDEPPEMCIALRSYCEVIKVFSIDEGFSFQETEPYLNAADYFLFDTRTALKGGSGTRFSWNKLNGYVFDKPYFLSGGIGPEHIEELMNLSDLRLYAIDVNSRFETEPGIKDINKLTPVFNTLRSREERHEP
jgi:phosphoribosylanthranilate isomerase